MSERAILWRMFFGALLATVLCGTMFALSGLHVFWLFASAAAMIFTFFTFMGALMSDG